MKVIRVHFYCGCYKSFPSEFYPTDECTTEGIITVPIGDWIEGVVEHTCPGCGAPLTQSLDHFTRVKGESDEKA